MPVIIAKKCVPAVSRWVELFILTCDNELCVMFKPHGVCCYYPGTNEALFNLALVWGSPGKFVWRFLYRKRPYRIIKPPCPKQDCGVAVACCANSIPTTLHLTWTNGTGSCACLNNTAVVALPHTSGSTWALANWTSPCGGPPTSLTLFCTGGATDLSGWTFTEGTEVSASPPTAGSTCSPVNFIFDLTLPALSSLCGDAGTVRATITV